MIDPDRQQAIRHLEWGTDVAAAVALLAPANRSQDCGSVPGPPRWQQCLPAWAAEFDTAEHVSYRGAKVLLGS